jgi:hypothetical protein
MPRARTITLPDGTRWPVAVVRQIIREQRPVAVEQPTLFELREDARPKGERNAAERYAEPSLFTR